MKERKTYDGRGRPRAYAQQTARLCFDLRESGKSYTSIAEKLGLPRSETARWLYRRFAEEAGNGP